MVDEIKNMHRILVGKSFGKMRRKGKLSISHVLGREDGSWTEIVSTGGLRY
jgi:hypothetical protein